jgi:hypothetical protein
MEVERGTEGNASNAGRIWRRWRGVGREASVRVGAPARRWLAAGWIFFPRRPCHRGGDGAGDGLETAVLELGKRNHREQRVMMESEPTAPFKGATCAADDWSDSISALPWRAAHRRATRRRLASACRQPCAARQRGAPRSAPWPRCAAPSGWGVLADVPSRRGSVR